MLTGFDPKQIQDLDGARQAIGLLLNLVEELKSENDALRDEVQKLRDEVNRLQGEQGKPEIRPQTQNGNISSEAERKKKKKKGKRSKRIPPKIDRTERCSIDRSTLPEDAVSKGVEKVVVQDIIIKTDNVEFHREVF